ncbi:MAG: lipopolysaccharide biosynthesis protein [Oscillospiraceae bacterium]|nr:lipopolysaccharide biosynthesis protein [Oscillospiraceae bacterium]
MPKSPETKKGIAGHILRTMLTTGMAYVLNFGITLGLAPYITKTVGTAAYGFITLSKQFAQYATILTTALNTYAARYIGIEYHRDNNEQARVYAASVFWGDFALASAILALSGILIFSLEYVMNVPAQLVSDVKLLFLLVFLGFFVTTTCSVFGCTGYVVNRTDLTGIFKTLSYLVNGLVMIVLFRAFPPKVFYVGAGTLAAALVIGGSDFWITKRYLPNLSFSRRYFSFSAIKRLVVDGFWASFSMIGDLLNNGLDLLVCNQMLTSVAMGQISIAKTMHMVVQSLYMIVDQAFFPRFLRCYAKDEKGALIRELKISMKVSGLLTNLVFAGFVALGMAYYRLWIPGEDTRLIYELTVITISTCISTGAIHPLYYIYTLTLKKKVPCIVTIVGGFFNVAGMYILIRYYGMGAHAVVWTTTVVMAVINFVTNPLYMAHVLHIPYGTFYPDILKNTLACGVLTAVFCGLSRIWMPDSWPGLVLCIVLYSLIGTPLHVLLVCTREQRQGLISIIKAKPHDSASADQEEN